jgi:hypothetical protein
VRVASHKLISNTDKSFALRQVCNGFAGHDFWVCCTAGKSLLGVGIIGGRFAKWKIGIEGPRGRCHCRQAVEHHSKSQAVPKLSTHTMYALNWSLNGTTGICTSTQRHTNPSLQKKKAQCRTPELHHLLHTVACVGGNVPTQSEAKISIV